MTSLIGDPTVIGWALAFGYALVAWQAWLLAGSARARGEGCSFWYLLSVLFCALAVNKQLDLQSYLREFAIFVLETTGLYDLKTLAKLALLVGFLFLALVIGGVGFCTFWLQKPRPWLTLAACIMLCAFLCLRVVSFQNLGLLDRVPSNTWYVCEITILVMMIFDTRQPKH